MTSSRSCSLTRLIQGPGGKSKDRHKLITVERTDHSLQLGFILAVAGTDS